MIDERSYFIALKAMLVKGLISDCEGDWAIMPQYYLCSFGSNWLVFQTSSGDKPDKSLERIPDVFFKT